jgi:hypothetical protein
MAAGSGGAASRARAAATSGLRFRNAAAPVYPDGNQKSAGCALLAHSGLQREMLMRDRRIIAAAIIASFAWVSVGKADDPAKYPDWSGQWRWPIKGANRYDPTKAPGRAQQAPLTPEYQAIFEASLADQAAGGQGANASYACIPAGLPRDLAGNQGFEFVVTPKTTHVVYVNAMPRRIYTDGRAFPDDAVPTFGGYSIGHWTDTDGDGVYDQLEIETRNFNGPRTFDNAGIPLHSDNQTIVKERIWRDPANPEMMHNEVTTFDHALTRPWTVHKTYVLQKKPVWIENICSVGNQHVQIGKEGYFLSAEGLLMPSKKGQAAPDLRYFKQVQK